MNELYVVIIFKMIRHFLSAFLIGMIVHLFYNAYTIDDAFFVALGVSVGNLIIEIVILIKNR